MVSRIFVFVGVQLRQLALGARQPLLGSQQQPLDGLGAVSTVTVAGADRPVVVKDAKIALRVRVAPIRGAMSHIQDRVPAVPPAPRRRGPSRRFPRLWIFLHIF